MKMSAVIGLVLACDIVVRAGAIPSSANPYAQVIARNIFGLNSSTVEIVPQPIKPVVKITPNGIVSILGQVQVLIKAVDETGKETSYILAEGQRTKEVEVVKIDEEKRLVTFNNYGLIEQIALGDLLITRTGSPTP